MITSEHLHDFKTCKCGNLSIDGGNEYGRILYKKANSYQDLSEYIANLSNKKRVKRLRYLIR